MERTDMLREIKMHRFGEAYIPEEKRAVFISLIDRYSLITFRLLKYYSEDYHAIPIGAGIDDDKNWFKTYYSPEPESPFDGIAKFIPELANEKGLVQTITSQLAVDGLIESVKWDLHEFAKEAQRKRTTVFGVEFLRFIATKSDSGQP